MITWMQTHKKWLIVTIWIATIAFIGAGFVGWGAYSYGKKQDEVARVKDTSIKVKDIQEIYNQLYVRLNKMMGGKLDEATAKQLGLEKEAFKEALKRAILIQFAKDNGLYITDEELAKAIASIPAFQKDGKFNKTLYREVLKNNRLTPKEFEENVRKEVLMDKITKVLNLPPTDITYKTIGSFVTMEDKIAIKIIDAPTIEVDEEEIKNYWEKHKDNYKSELSYDIGYYYVPVDGKVSENELNSYYEEHKLEYTDSNGTILPLENVKEKVEKAVLAKKRKRDAIITMKKLKKGELQFKTISNVTLNNSYIPLSLMQKLVETKFLKPSLTEKGWLIAKLIKVNKPVILPYEKAKELAKEDLIKEKRVAVLEKLAKESLKQFKGKEIGFVGKDDVMKLQMLSVEDATDFLTSLFASKTAEGYTLLPKDVPNKVVVYKIKEQKLLDDNKYKKYKDNIGQYTKNLKREEFENSLIEELKKLYQSQIKVYMKI